MANLLLRVGLAMLDVFTRWRAAGGSSPGPAGFAGDSAGRRVPAWAPPPGLVAAPCGAPAFAAVLTFVAATGSAVLGFLYLFVFSLGLTALLVAGRRSSAAPWRRCPGRAEWTLWVKRAGGVVLSGMAEYYFVKMGSVL